MSLLLIGQIDAAAVSELDAGFGDQVVVLLVAEAAIEKCCHGKFLEASSGPRSMA